MSFKAAFATPSRLTGCYPLRLAQKCDSRPATSRAPQTRSAVRVSCVERPPWSIDVEGVKDDKLYDLEENLHAALDNEQYESANSIKQEITRLQSGGFADVLTSFFSYYTAINSKSITDIARIFAQDENVTCKHPMAPLITGYINVINSFGFIFSHEMPLITAEKPRISLRGSIAYVTCEEVITPRVEPGTLRTNFVELNPNFSAEPAEIRMVAVKIYVKRNGQYLLTHQTSSPRGPID